MEGKEMINVIVTRRQLFLLVVGTPLATVLLFVLGVHSGAAMGAPGLATEATPQSLEGTEKDMPSTAATTESASAPPAAATATGPSRRLSRSPASRAALLENRSRTAKPDGTAAAEARTTTRNDQTNRLYSIQAGVFSELSNARRLRRELESLGYDSRLEVVDTPEPLSQHFRIRIGMFDSRDAADAALERYRQDETPDAFVVSRALDRS